MRRSMLRPYKIGGPVLQRFCQAREFSLHDCGSQRKPEARFAFRYRWRTNRARRKTFVLEEVGCGQGVFIATNNYRDDLRGRFTGVPTLRAQRGVKLTRVLL